MANTRLIRSHKRMGNPLTLNRNIRNLLTHSSIHNKRTHNSIRSKRIRSRPTHSSIRNHLIHRTDSHTTNKAMHKIRCNLSVLLNWNN